VHPACTLRAPCVHPACTLRAPCVHPACTLRAPPACTPYVHMRRQAAELMRSAAAWRRAAHESLGLAAALLLVLARVRRGAALLHGAPDGATDGAPDGGRAGARARAAAPARWNDTAKLAALAAAARAAAARAPIAAVWLTVCDQLCGDLPCGGRGDGARSGGGGGSGGARGGGGSDGARGGGGGVRAARAPAGAEVLEDAALCGAAGAVLAALSEASGSPPHLLRAGLLGGCCQLLHLRLEAADAAGATHPQRRLARALRNCVCAVRRPHLGRAEGSHRLLPLLLRWCEA